MGINQQVLKFLLHKNAYRPIQGNILLIGKSTVTLSIQDINKIYIENNLTAPKYEQVDKSTRHCSDEFVVDDKELIQKLSPLIENIDILDVSQYEGANIIADMNIPVPEHLHRQYDFIYDSSVMDNVFSPASFICNIANMLAPGGRVMMLNVASFYPGAFTSVHPEWIYSFFALNNFSDCKVYLTEQTASNGSRFIYDTDLWLYGPSFSRSLDYDYFSAVKRTCGVCHTLVIAEKSIASEKIPLRFPINLQYLSSSGAPDSDWPARKFFTDRPLLQANSKKTPMPVPPHLSDHYTYLGSSF